MYVFVSGKIIEILYCLTILSLKRSIEMPCQVGLYKSIAVFQISTSYQCLLELKNSSPYIKENLKDMLLLYMQKQK